MLSAMIRASALALLVVLPVAAAAEKPAWVAQVPDFRSAWPEPLPTGSAAPEFSLADVAGKKRVSLKAARKGRKATLVLFLDDHCGTCRRRAADLASTLRRSLAVDGTAVLVVFTRNLAKEGPKGAIAFAKEAGFPDVPLLYDGKDGRAEVTIAWRVMVTPCAAVLDADGKLAYFGLALPREGSDLVPGIIAAVAAGKPLDGPAARPPYG
jgi:peroxiredoxin